MSRTEAARVSLPPRSLLSTSRTGPTTRSSSRAAEGAELRVLVVEDNAADRWYFSELLRSRGYTVTSCEDGETAWESFQESPAPLVLLDLMLPGMDGAALCKQMRGHPQGVDPFILVITGREEPETLSEILEAGADDFVRKPVEPALLDVRLAIAERRIGERLLQRRTEADLAHKTEELAALFENLSEVFFSVDLEIGRLIQISPGAMGLFETDVAQLEDSPDLWRHFLLPATRADPDPWARLRAEAPPSPIMREYPVRLPSGTTRWIRATVTLEVDAEGRPRRADGFAVDVTEEQRARTELAERTDELAALYRVGEISLTSVSLEEAYAQILDQMADVLDVPILAIEHLDPQRDRLIVTASRGFPASPGVDLWEESVHQSLSGQAIQTGVPVVETNPRAIRDRGPEALAETPLAFLGAFPLVADGNATGVLLLASREGRTWSERHTRRASNLATSIASYVERLEAEEALRENEARYRHLAAQLKQANQELESFAYSVSHDLRAPLRTMQGFAHTLLQKHGEALDPEAEDYVRRIITSGQQSEQLIGDLLSYSRLSFEKLELKPVELQAVVDTALEQAQADISESNAYVDVEGNLPTVLGSHTILVQVLTNLLSNAVKFVPLDRKPEIRIHAEQRESQVRLWVEDNGIGIPPDQEDRIFRVFERLTEVGDRPGTGIGLAIVRRGMQRVGGSCGVQRLPDRGSAFWIQMPKERRRGGWRPWTRRKG